MYSVEKILMPKLKPPDVLEILAKEPYVFSKRIHSEE